MWRLRRVLRHDATFFYGMLVCITLVLISGRLFCVDYTARRQAARNQIVNLLNAVTFPNQRESRQAVLAAVLNVASSQARCDSTRTQDSIRRGEVWRIEQDIHAAMVALCTAAEAPEPARGLMVENWYRRLGGEETGYESWTRAVKLQCGRFSRELSPSGVESDPRPRNPFLESQFGPVGIDPERREQTTLHVPGITYSTMASSDSAACSARVRHANDCSLIMEYVMQLVAPQLREIPGHDDRLVQVFFLSPDGLLRYWSVDGKSAPEAFRSQFTWTASPLLAGPFDVLATTCKDVTQGKLYSEIANFRSDSTGTYIDYGGYGLVRTRRTPIWDSKKKLVGFLCTDVTKRFRPVSAAGCENKTRHARTDTATVLFDWAVLDGPDGKLQVRLQSSDASAFKPNGLDLLGAVQSAAAAGIDYYDRVQAIPAVNPAGFVVPLGFESGVRTLLLLVPKAPRQPAKSLVAFATFGIVALVFTALRIAYRTHVGPSESEAAALRGLQAGVINVDDTGHIWEGNDRAEEILGRRFINFGVEHDLADPAWLDEIIESQVLYRRSPDCPSSAKKDADDYTLMTLDEVRAARRSGRRVSFYARLKEEASRVSPPSETPAPGRWVRFKGAPWLGGSRSWFNRFNWGSGTAGAGSRPAIRATAVVHTVRTDRATYLYNKREELRHPQ